MLKIALTGGIGSGKSLVGSMLKERGFTVIDLDSIVSSLYKRQRVRKEILALFGTLDRREIARKAFSQVKKRKALETLLQPRAWRELNHRLLKLSRQRAVFVEVPLLFEAGFEKEFDFIVVVFAPEKKRLERLVKRGMSKRDALRRMQCQFPDKEKVKKANFTIDNSNGIDATRKQVGLLVKELAGNTVPLD